MKNSFNILLIAFLLVFASSCNKFAPLESASDVGDNYEVESGESDNLLFKSGEDEGDVLDAEGSITDPEHDEDHDSDGTITDTDNEEDHDKENADKG